MMQKRGILISKFSDIRHLIESGALVYTWLDLETTDKDWRSAEITVASLTITDIAYNLISDDLFEVCVPDRVGLSPEAMLITRYMAPRVRDSRRLSPQKAVAQIYETIQDAPRRLWVQLGEWEGRLGSEIWADYVREQEVAIAGPSGAEKKFMVRHFPTLNEKNEIIHAVRVHEPKTSKEFMEMSYQVGPNEGADYEDSAGRWKIKELDKYNLGFRNTFFDNRLLAAALFRANFPQKALYALNRKGLGNHSTDVFTAALTDHFFSPDGASRIKMGRKRDAESSREKISAKLDLLMDENTRHADADVALPEGVRIYDGTLHNLKRGHNAPDYDNAKAIGLHSYIRRHNPGLLARVEATGQIDAFRSFMTLDHEDGVPTTHPIRFCIVSANDDAIYRPVPLIILGSDDQHGKFNRIWGIRADIDPRLTLEGKTLLDMSAKELAAIIRSQRGQPDALFHEINLRRHKGVASLEDGLRAGHGRGLSIETYRHIRDEIVEHLDAYDVPFLNKALDAFALQHVYAAAPADDIPQPYVEEEIWTAMGDVKYPYIQDETGKPVRLPNLVRELAQEEFKRLNDRVGDTLRDLLRPQPLELSPSIETALAYVELRKKKEKKLAQYQSGIKEGKKIQLLPPCYDPAVPHTAKTLSLEEVYATLIQDKLYLMDKCPSTTRSYEVQRLIPNGLGSRKGWQRIPFKVLAEMTESRLLALKNDGCLRVSFEKNPNSPALRFAIRYFIENGMADLLGQTHRDFYIAETAMYAHGPSYIQDPNAHRVMSIPKILQAIEKVRTNIKSGNAFTAASRHGEEGAASQFLNDDFSEAILDSVHTDAIRRQRRYAQTDKRKFQFSVDPQSNRPLLNAKYEIPDDHLIVPVPDAHPGMTISHDSFGHTCLVISDLPALRKARHIVLEEQVSGRRYYAADPVLLPLPSRTQGAFERFYQLADRAYTESGIAPPESGVVLSCAELAPIAKTKDPQHPSLRIPQRLLLATRTPALSGLQRDEGLTTFMLRKYDLKLKKGQKIRLRGVDEAKEETGWEGVTRVSTKPLEISLSELLKKLNDSACFDEMDHLAYACGYGTADDLRARALAEFSSFDETIGQPDQMLVFVTVSPVKRISYWTPHAPRACFERKLNRPDNAPVSSPRAKLARKAPSMNLE